MTYIEIYVFAKNILKSANIENYSFDASLIFEHCFKIARRDLPLCAHKEAPVGLCDNFFKLVNKRKEHHPLQYILGEWNFMGRMYKVGEGVLIPRNDTEVLVNKCIQFLSTLQNRETINVLDLCSGTGIIAITLAKQFKNANITAVELYPEAFKYLEKNIKIHRALNVNTLKCNVLSEKLPSNLKNKKFNLIVSNPPYIKSAEIQSLQEEVRKEPIKALDGGEDGLVFYKAILKNWKTLLSKGSAICAEIGMGQSKSVYNLFKINSFKNVETIRDLNNIPRVIFGIT